ncbi:extensin-like [Iris pallida]|uniref:Extensin-like n=1 Tax=Iris pallida TaxID=29817 RepID=A0AAX6E7H4_IRIPA|nr:extensin-like [Iris pallida]
MVARSRGSAHRSRSDGGEGQAAGSSAARGGKAGPGPAGLAPRRQSEVSDRRSSDWGGKRLQIWWI